MSSSHHHHRTSSTRPTRRIQIVALLHTHRSASAPHRQFIIILTNNPELLRQTRIFQPQQNIQTTTVSAHNSATNHAAVNSNNREQILNNLLRV
ncbi:unnamed protein product [Rotaria sordida]|uniref:Uncharacterized protein n=1 Tax=Rotaria sordida TaxID=392033 RepID=A0A815V9A0_9BILA|nr:unnamed protein product [Rotaria sordida]CAF1247509.1 unnamed protein product [Rotaria sordida]CAF1529073.1 unnamed protein product [Rotaria sordida]CAF3908101.1 unnamed protein product [Rotaria sordida]